MITQKRYRYLDNLRWLIVLLLIPYHLAIAYNTWGERTYIFLGTSNVLSAFAALVEPFAMPLLFLLAGMSAKLSLEKRGFDKFTVNRVMKLLVPLLVGTLVLVPPLTYVCNTLYNGFEGSYWQGYAVFFSNWHNLNGFDGGFTVAHLWFLLLLFVLALITLPLCVLLDRWSESHPWAYFFAALGLLTVGCAFNWVLVFGRSIVTYVLAYVAGYMLTQDRVEKLCEARWVFAPLFALCAIAYSVITVCGNLPTLSAFISPFAALFGMLAAVTLGRTYWNRTNKVYKFLNKRAMVIYVVHFPLCVVTQYLFLSVVSDGWNFVLSLPIGTVATFLVTEAIVRTPVLRVGFGITPRKKKPKDVAPQEIAPKETAPQKVAATQESAATQETEPQNNTTA